MHFYFDPATNLPVRTPQPTAGLVNLSENQYKEIVIGLAGGTQYQANNSTVSPVIDNTKRATRWYEAKTTFARPDGLLETAIIEKDPDLCLEYIKSIRKQVESTGVFKIKGTNVPINERTLAGIREALASNRELIDWKLGNGDFVDLTPVELQQILSNMLTWQQDQRSAERKYTERYLAGERWAPFNAEVWSLEDAESTPAKKPSKTKRSK